MKCSICGSKEVIGFVEIGSDANNNKIFTKFEFRCLNHIDSCY